MLASHNVVSLHYCNRLILPKWNVLHDHNTTILVHMGR